MPQGSDFEAFFARTRWFSFCFLTISAGSLSQILPVPQDMAARIDRTILRSCIFFNLTSVISSLILTVYSTACSFRRRSIGEAEHRKATIVFIITIVLLALTTFLFMLLLGKPYSVLVIIPLVFFGITVRIARGGRLADPTLGAVLSEADASRLLKLSSFVTTLTTGGIIGTIIPYSKNFSNLGHRSHLEFSMVFLFFNNTVGFFAMLLVSVLSILHYPAPDGQWLLIVVANFFTYASFVLLAFSTLVVASESLGLPYVFFPMLFSLFGALNYLLTSQKPAEAAEVADLEDMLMKIGTFGFALFTTVHALHLGNEEFALKIFMFLCVSALIGIQSQMLLWVFRPPNTEIFMVRFTFFLIGALLIAALSVVFFIWGT